MTPTRIIEAPGSEAERQIALAASVDPAPLDRAGWDEITGRALMRSPSPWRLLPAFALSTLAGVMLVLVVRPLLSSSPPAPKPAELIASADSRWSHVSPEELSLQSGRLTFARPNGRVVRIRTPDALLETTNARFLAEVVPEGTTVMVEEGDVVLRSGTVERTIHAGESVTWPPSPVIPDALSVEQPIPGGKCQGEPASLRTCLEAESAGTSLDAEAAGYELGVLEARARNGRRAIEVFRGSLARFPTGVLAPEVRIALLVELVKSRRFAEGVVEARAFVEAWPEDPRRGDVEALGVALSKAGH